MGIFLQFTKNKGPSAYKIRDYVVNLYHIPLSISEKQELNSPPATSLELRTSCTRGRSLIHLATAALQLVIIIMAYCYSWLMLLALLSCVSK